MPKCTGDKIEFGKLGRRVIEADFSGGDLSSDGGMMLLKQVDERIGLTRAAAAVLSDPRDAGRIVHSMRDLLAQRIEGLCCGHEDLNDHDRLREDVLVQTALGRVDALASSPTLCRMETRATQAQAWALHEVLVAQFIASHDSAPAGLVLDIDASDIALHGNQELREFHGYYDHHCYLPLYVFCGDALLACYLSAQPHRWGQERHGRSSSCSSRGCGRGLARCADHRARGFGLLPPAPDALV